MIRIPFVVLVLVLLSGGCALLGKSDPLVPRYFSPEAPDGSLGANHTTPRGAPAGLALRIGRVGGGSYLKERIVFRESNHELGFYEDRRWTERPEVYLQRALERSFFEERGVQRAVSGASPTLTAELIEFEEVREAAGRVRIEVSYALHDDRRVIRERTFMVEQAIAAGENASRPERIAAGLGDALGRAVAEIVDQVIADLEATPATPPVVQADGSHGAQTK
ncbi:MAG: ABC-type transport auxiliary lipoprotein family protein [Myxococcota bacterium]|nr:ABC-type transport auxiliary lipoprotein family protein [Myxococcota bacterium]